MKVSALDRVLEKVEDLKREGTEWRALCPVHGGHSLTINEASDGKVLLTCHGCGATAGDLVAKLGLRLTDLFPNDQTPAPAREKPVEDLVTDTDRTVLARWLTTREDLPDTAYQYLEERWGIDQGEARNMLHLGYDPGTKDPDRPRRARRLTGRRWILIPFTDPAGHTGGMQARALDDREPRWETLTGKGWAPYGCFGLDRPDPVIITEGPGDALTAYAAGYPTIGIRGAAMTGRPITDALARDLAGRTVIVAGDNDEAGRKFTHAIVSGLAAAGIDARGIELPDGTNDLTDWAARDDWADELADTIDRAQPPATSRNDPQPPDGEGPSVELTDLGNARRFVATHGDRYRWVPQWKRWIHWNGTRWVRDLDGQAERDMKQVIDELLTAAFAVTDSDDRKRALAWAIRSQDARRIGNALTLARTEPGIPVQPGELDADPWALNVANGTIDLRTGTPLAHDPARLITKLADVTYRPDAHDPRWDQFLYSATQGNEELVGFLQRAVGYTLTGTTVEEKLFFVHGPTRAGKSTFAEGITGTFGDYHRRADFETFLVKQGDGGARHDIARLAGARLVISNEIEDGKKLAEGLVKSLTGGDTITARELYQDLFEFVPAFKLWLVANHAPKVRHGDDAIWARICMIPFEHTVGPDELDPTLKPHLATPAARSAILSWAVEGCLAWQQVGLQVPDTVRHATDEYRETQDPLGDFLADRCNMHPDLYATSKDLRREYDDWADENGIVPRARLSVRAFAAILEERGCTSSRRRIGGRTERVWNGIGVLDLTASNLRDRNDQFGEGDRVARVADDMPSDLDRDTSDAKDAFPRKSLMRARRREVTETDVTRVHASRGELPEREIL